MKLEPNKIGIFDHYFVEFNENLFKIENSMHISIDNGLVSFDKSNLIFSLILNQDILSINSKEEVLINSVSIRASQMIFLEENDSILAHGYQFKIIKKREKISSDIEQIEIEEDLPPPLKKDPGFDLIDELQIEEKKITKIKALNSFVRFLAIIIECLIAKNIADIYSFSILNDFEGISFLNKVGMSVGTVNNGLSANLYFFAMRLSASLLFGVSLGQLLLGVRSSSRGLTGRAKDFLREMIGLFTGLFIIFDLGTLVNKRSFKEVISKTYIYGRGFLVTTFLFLLSSIVLVNIYFIIPFLNQSFSDKEISVRRISLSFNHTSGDFIASDFFGLSFDSTLKPLISFKLYKEKENYIYRPEIYFALNDFKISKAEPVNLASWFRSALSEDPFLVKEYPELFVNYLSSLTMDKSVKQKINKIKLQKEIISFIQRSFSLNLDNYVDHAFNHGPFVRGYIKFKSIFYEKFLKIEDLSVFEVNEELFLQVRHDKKSISLFNLNSDKVIHVSSKKIKDALKAISFVNNGQEGLLSLIDYLNMENLKLEKSFELSFKYLKNNLDVDQSIKEKIIKSFESQINYLNKIASKRDDKDSIDKYVQLLIDSIRAYKENDTAHFGVVNE